MSRYMELRQTPPKLEIKKDAKEVVFTIVSVMCDNINKITVKKQDNGEFDVSGHGFSLSNYAMKGDYKTDIKWSADDGDWDAVICTINSGTSVIESVRSR